jgi:hypothetical protein
MKTAKKIIPSKPKFTQENFEKILNELDKLNSFCIKLYSMPWWRRGFFGKSIIKKYLKGKL